MDLKIIRLPEVMAKVGLKKSAIYSLIRQGKFPAQIRLGTNASGWLASDIDGWLSSQANEAARKAAVNLASIIRMPLGEEEVLHPREIAHITGCKDVPSQARWLTEHRWRFHHSEAGDLIIGRLFARLTLAGIDPSAIR